MTFTAAEFTDAGTGEITTASGAWVAPVTSVATASSSVARATWTANEVASSYLVEYRINGGAWTSAGAAVGTSADLPASPGLSFDVRTQAFHVNGSSDWSNVASVVMGLDAPVITVVRAGSRPSQTATVSWASVPGASSYVVERDDDEAGTYATSTTTATTSYTVAGGTGNRVRFRVSARNGAGVTSSKSTVVEVKFTGTSGHVPEGAVDQVVRSGTDVTVSGWVSDWPDGSAPTDVHIYWVAAGVSGDPRAVGTGTGVHANVVRNDVQAAKGYPHPRWGWGTTLKNVSAGAKVCVYGIDTNYNTSDPADNAKEFGCWTV